MIDTKERQKREKFLRERGSYSDREKRECMLQRHELKAQIDILKDNIDRFAGAADDKSLALRSAWQKELIQKQRLLLTVLRGQTVARDEINAHISEVQVLKSLVTKRRFEAAMLDREVR